MNTLTYKSTRHYDFKLLERHIDFDSLVDHTMTALNGHRNRHFIDGMIGATLHITYPDLKSVEPSTTRYFHSYEVSPDFPCSFELQ